MKNAIGIDIGYGYTKVYGPDKFLRVFPTQVAKVRPRGSFGVETDVVLVNGQSFIVGDEITSFGDYSVSKEFVGTPEYLALMGHSLAMAKCPCDILVMGLPPGFYDESLIEKLAKLISVTDIRNINKEIIPVPKTVKFIPQGAGIYFDYINNLPVGATIPNNVVVIDMGHYTMDLVMFSGGRYHPGSAKSFPLGMSKLINNIKSTFTKEYGAFLNNDECVLKLIKDGVCTHSGKTYTLDVAPLIDEYMHTQVLKELENYSTEMKSSTRKSADKTVIGGGGVSCLAKFSGNAAVVEDPQMSNAKGYYLFGQRYAEISIHKAEKMPIPRVLAA